VSLPLCFSKLRSGKAGAGPENRLKPPPIASFTLSTFGKTQRSGCAPAEPYPPRLHRKSRTAAKNEKEGVTPKPKSVTYVLNQECYLCPDCACWSVTLNFEPGTRNPRRPDEFRAPPPGSRLHPLEFRRPRFRVNAPECTVNVRFTFRLLAFIVSLCRRSCFSWTAWRWSIERILR
jgi:hypothetical protein